MSLVITDQHIRDELLNNGIQNTLVSASAGAGKTTIMIEKIKSVLELEETHRTVATITFTIKATNEIKERLRNNDFLKEVVVSTNDGFVESEIIRPFIRDTSFGKEINNDFTIEYTNNLFRYDKGLEKLRKDNILGSYNGRMRKNFKFELAKNILEDSIAARQYLESKYFMIFLDEYQDSDLEMHELFMYLKNVIGIHLFIVGDNKQAIYLWRGAQKDIFERLANERFNKYILTHNFRCDPEISNFANFVHHFEAYKEQDNEVTNMVLCKTENSLESCIVRLISNGELDIKKEITILINVNATAEAFAKSLQELGYNFIFIPKTPIDEGLLNTFFLKQLARLYFDEYYSIYDFCEILNIENTVKNIRLYEKIFKTFIYKEELDFNKIKEVCKEFAEKTEFNIAEEEISKLTETLTNSNYKICFVPNDSKFKVMTVFGSKGLEFEQVVAFGRDYDLENEERLNAHYVAVTRAKEKMIIIDNTIVYTNKLASIFSTQDVSSEEKRKKIIKVISL